MRIPIFSGKRGIWGPYSQEDFPRKLGKGGSFCNCQWYGGITFSRDRGGGFQVIGNERRYTLVLWEWVGGGEGGGGGGALT